MKTLALLLTLALAPLAHAQSDRGMYFGAGLGSFDYDEGVGGVADSTYAYHLFGGYKFNEHIALEGGISGTGDLKESFTETVPGFGDVTLNVKQNLDIYSFTALGILPFDSMSLFAGVGYFSASLSGTVDAAPFGSGAFDGSHDNGVQAKLGIQHDFGLDLKSLSIRAQYDFYDFSDNVDVSGITVAVLFRF
jgi:hypothetical protein